MTTQMSSAISEPPETLPTPEFVISLPTCRVNGCDAEIPPDHIVCERHWSRVDPKTQKRFFEALMAVLDEAAVVPVGDLVHI